MSATRVADICRQSLPTKISFTEALRSRVPINLLFTLFSFYVFSIVTLYHITNIILLCRKAFESIKHIYPLFDLFTL